MYGRNFKVYLVHTNDPLSYWVRQMKTTRNRGPGGGEPEIQTKNMPPYGGDPGRSLVLKIRQILKAWLLEFSNQDNGMQHFEN
jgi:hypothetical protein